MDQRDDHSMRAGGNIIGSVINTGSDSTVTATYQHVTLPAAESVDVAAELAGLREVLAGLGGADQARITAALDAADAETKAAAPDKPEVARPIERALTLAKQAETFSGHAEAVIQRVTRLAGWLGPAGTRLLQLLNLTP